MNKRTLKGFGDKPKIPKRVFLFFLVSVLVISTIYLLMNVSLDFSVEEEEKILDNYQKRSNFTIQPIGDSKANKFTFDGEGCWLEYSLYEFKNQEEASNSIKHRDFLGRGFLEHREYDVLDWANESRVDFYYRKIDDFENKTNMIRRIVLWFNLEIYDIETNCNEGVEKLAFELVNN